MLSEVPKLIPIEDQIYDELEGYLQVQDTIEEIVD